MALQRLKSTEDKAFGDLLSNMFASITAAHMLHLKVTGKGSYAQHKALGSYYEELPDLLDSIAEGYQGHYLKLIDVNPITPPVIKNIEEFVNHLNSLYIIISKTQDVTMCSSLKNTLDEAKSLINTTKYKLHFLE
jgi:hypothetical protein